MTLSSTAVERAIAQCTSRWAMARGHRLNTSYSAYSASVDVKQHKSQKKVKNNNNNNKKQRKVTLPTLPTPRGGGGGEGATMSLSPPAVARLLCGLPRRGGGYYVSRCRLLCLPCLLRRGGGYYVAVAARRRRPLSPAVAAAISASRRRPPSPSRDCLRRLSTPWSLPTLPPLGRGELLSLLYGGGGGGTTRGGGGGSGGGGHSVARRRRLPSPPAVESAQNFSDSGGWAQSLARYCHPSIW